MARIHAVLKQLFLGDVACGPQIYLDDDDAVIKALDAESEEGEDQDKDIKPFHAGHHSERNGTAEQNNEDGEDANFYGTWTLRKCSAAGLDLLSGVFGDELLTVLMPTVQQRLQVGFSMAWDVKVHLFSANTIVHCNSLLLDW